MAPTSSTLSPSDHAVLDLLEWDLGLSHELDQRPDDPTLRQAAKHVILPAGAVDSLWPRVRHRLDMLDVVLDLWQQGLAQGALAINDAGRFAATVGGVVASIPRQVGKSYFLSRLLVAMCIEFPGLRCIWTSHHGRTTTNTFRGVSGLVQSAKIRPYMKPGPTAGVRTTNGEQEIAFANGSIILFGARESGFGRGMDAVDIMVFDEAQILGLKALEDMVPATNAAKNPHGGLIFFIGTPPRPQDDGEAFRTKRANALTGKTRNGMYVEIAGKSSIDPHDPINYRIANPSYPLRVPLESMHRMAENLPDVGAWKREALGIWDEIVAGRRLMPAWDDRVGSGPSAKTRPVAFGVDRSVYHGISIVAGWHMPNERIHIEEVWAGSDLEAAADFLKQAARLKDTIFVDAMSPAAPLIPLMQARKRKCLRTTTSEFISAAALMEAGIEAGSITHGEDTEMAAATKAVVHREIRSAGKTGGVAFARPEGDTEAPIHKLIAGSLAVLGAQRTKRVDPNAPTRTTRSSSTR